MQRQDDQDIEIEVFFRTSFEPEEGLCLNYDKHVCKIDPDIDLTDSEIDDARERVAKEFYENITEEIEE